jgi:hypothetical protein
MNCEAGYQAKKEIDNELKPKHLRLQKEIADLQVQLLILKKKIK